MQIEALFLAYFPEGMDAEEYIDWGEEREDLFAYLDCLLFLLESIRQEGPSFQRALGFRELSFLPAEDGQAFAPVIREGIEAAEDYQEEILALMEQIGAYLDQRRALTGLGERDKLPFYTAISETGLSRYEELAVLCAYAAACAPQYAGYLERLGQTQPRTVSRAVVDALYHLLEGEPADLNAIEENPWFSCFFEMGEGFRLTPGAVALLEGRSPAEEAVCLYAKRDEAPACPIYQDSAEKLTRICAADPDTALALLLVGEPGCGKTKLARQVLFSRYEQVAVLCLDRVQREPETLTRAVREAALTAFLSAAGLVVTGLGDRSSAEQRILFQTLRQLHRPVFFLTTEEERAITELPCVKVVLPLCSEREKTALWNFFLQALPLSETERAALAASYANRYDMTVADMKKTVADAQGYLAGGADLREALATSCYHARAHSLGTIAERIYTDFTMDDLVVEEETRKQLEYIMAQVRYKGLVGETWGFYEKIPYGRGISALFSGPPGTGKTMAVQVIGNELGIDVFRVDISQMVSKYVGETEKNISELFRRAESMNAILFFDEADALFAKRSEVQDANDRNANAETAHLLQKMEGYQGIVILATNLRENIDDAFKRRMKFSVTFRLPQAEERRCLWHKMFPPQAPREDLSLDFFADHFELSGSAIKEVVVNAAFIAAKDGVIRDSHIQEALKLHYEKAGKTLTEEAFRFLG